MPGLKITGFEELREKLLGIVETNDRDLAAAVHAAIIEEIDYVPVSGKTFEFQRDGKPASGPRNLSAGSLRTALVTKGRGGNHVWRWKKGKFSFGAKGGPRYGETALTGPKDRGERTGASRGPKGNVARALRFQGRKIRFSRNLASVAEAIGDVLFGRKGGGTDG